MMTCDIKSSFKNPALVALKIGDCENCISSENAENIAKKFRDSGSLVNVNIFPSKQEKADIIEVSVGVEEVIVDCHKVNEKSNPLKYTLKL